VGQRGQEFVLRPVGHLRLGAGLPFALHGISDGTVGALVGADVAHDLRNPDGRAIAPLDRRGGDRDVDRRSALGEPNGFELDSLARPRRAQHDLGLVPAVGRNDERDVTADHLVRGVSEHALGGFVPGDHDPFGGQSDDRDFRRLHERGEIALHVVTLADQPGRVLQRAAELGDFRDAVTVLRGRRAATELARRPRQSDDRRGDTPAHEGGEPDAYDEGGEGADGDRRHRAANGSIHRREGNADDHGPARQLRTGEGVVQRDPFAADVPDGAFRRRPDLGDQIGAAGLANEPVRPDVADDGEAVAIEDRHDPVGGDRAVLEHPGQRLGEQRHAQDVLRLAIANDRHVDGHDETSGDGPGEEIGNTDPLRAHGLGDAPGVGPRERGPGRDPCVDELLTVGVEQHDPGALARDRGRGLLPKGIEVARGEVHRGREQAETRLRLGQLAVDRQRDALGRLGDLLLGRLALEPEDDEHGDDREHEHRQQHRDGKDTEVRSHRIRQSERTPLPSGGPRPTIQLPIAAHPGE